MLSYIVYSALMLLCVVFAYISRKKDDYSWLIVSFIVLSFVSGARGISVGLDTVSYSKIFLQIANNGVGVTHTEIGFECLVWLLSKISPKSNFIFYILASITHGLVFIRLWGLKKKIYIEWAVFCYCAQCYFISLNIMRQMLAMAIIFFATKYLEEQDYIPFVLALLIATTIHTASMLGILFVIVDVFFRRRETRKKGIKQILIISAVACFSLLLIGVFKSEIITSLINKLFAFFSNIQIDLGFGTTVKLLMLITTFLIVMSELGEENNKQTSFIGKIKNIKNGYVQLSVADKYEITTISIYYLFAILFVSLDMFFPFMGRLGYVFYFFESVYIAWIFKNGRRTYYKIAYILLFLYIFIADMLQNTQGQMPYLFMW